MSQTAGSLEHNCLAPSPTAFLWTKDLRVPEIPGERQGLFGEGSARDARSSASHRMRTTGESTWGREEPRAGPRSATGFLWGSCPASLILEPISPEKEYNGCPGGIFLPSDSRAGLLRPSMSWPCSCPLLHTTSPVL